MGQRTVLYDWHVAHGGRMVDFAGWDMPVQYTTIIDEHVAVRTSAGLFDVSHMGRLFFGGPDAMALVQRVFTNNAAAMKEGQVRYGLSCNDQGGIRDDVLVYRWPDGFAMVVNAVNRAKMVDWLAASQGSLKATVGDRTLATGQVAIQGPRAVPLCQDLFGADLGPLGYYHGLAATYRSQPCLVSRTGYTGEDGLEVMVPAELTLPLWEELVSRGAKPCGLGARDTLRLEAGMPLYGHELSEDIDPFQAGLGWAVKLDQGDFRGRDALLGRRQDLRLRQRVGLELAGKRIARAGSRVLTNGQETGVITSGTFAPTLHKAIAMAYVAPACAQPGSACRVDIRGKEEAARVVPLPFYKRGQRSEVRGQE